MALNGARPLSRSDPLPSQGESGRVLSEGKARPLSPASAAASRNLADQCPGRTRIFGDDGNVSRASTICFDEENSTG
jgi:hypothetical protein